jgi:putative transcriptional regulator
MKTLLKTVNTMFTRDPKSTANPDITIKTPTMAPHVIDVAASTGYLAGQLLVATPLINSGCFHKAVVYVFAHNEEGAMGLIVNQPLELINYSALLEGMKLPDEIAQRELPVYFGGPLERARGFVVHSTDYKRDFTLARAGELAVTASSTILHDIVASKGPKQAILTVGYAGWTAGQLEQEIEGNSWITVPPSTELLFNTDNDLKWATASESLGVNMAFFSTTVGHA